jgi:N-acetylglutamate synthase-like GNAT family acetyltransferase
MNQPLNPSGYKVRRATTEDIHGLVELWKTMRYPTDDLVRRVTEFQLIEDQRGSLVGAIGMEILSRQGRLHSEAFVDFALAEQCRPLLWDRLNSLATNHGLLNIWTQEQAPFWTRGGFAVPGAEAMETLPAPWRAFHGKWLVLKLREELEAVLSMDQQFEMFMQAEKSRTQKALQRAKMLKTFATLIAAAVLFLVILAGIYIVRQMPGFR